MNEFAHIIERSIIHIFSAGTVYLGFCIGYEWFRRKFSKAMDQILPGLLAILIIYLREPFDVAHGQSLLKAVIDPISWAAGIAGVWWLIRRYRKVVV